LARDQASRDPFEARQGDAFHDDYGSKSRRGTEVAATFYTVIETAKLARIEPAAYLRAIAVADALGQVLLPDQFLTESRVTRSLTPRGVKVGIARFAARV
jgi:hypothetical protein